MVALCYSVTDVRNILLKSKKIIIKGGKYTRVNL